MPGSVKPRILVVDDDQDVIAAYRSALDCNVLDVPHGFKDPIKALGRELFDQPNNADVEASTWRVDFVNQGLDAFDAVCAAALDSDPYSVVFLDIRMPPGIDGCETARRIRQIDPNVHIVFVSGYSDYSEEELSEAAGPSKNVSFMQKPVWPLQLRTKALQLCQAA